MLELEAKYLIDLSNDSHEAFRYIYMQYQPKVKYFINHFVKSGAVAEELTQDIFEKIWVNRTSLPNLKSFNAYLYQMAKNAALNFLDKKLLEDKLIASYKYEYEESFEEKLYSKEIELLVQLTVAKMPEQRQKIYLMSRHENLKNSEIAEKLNISKKTVENHLNLALKEIRKTIILFFFFFF